MFEAGRTKAPVRVAYAFLDLGDGGAQRLTLAACRHLDPARYHASVLCLRGRGALVPAAEAQGLAVSSLGRLRRPNDVGAAAHAAHWLRANRIAVLHVALYSRSSPYARLAGRLAGVPLTVAHEWCRPGRPGRARAWADRIMRPGTRFVATSQALRHDLVSAGVPERDVAVVYSGIDTDLFSPGDREASRRLLGLPAGRPTVLVPARLHPMKGHVDLIAALVSLRGAVPGLLVLVAGSGPLGRALPALADAAGVADAVRFLGQRDDIPGLLAACDLVVLPSRVEGLPSAILEAMCAERPVVASAVGGVPEVMGDGTGGWLVSPRDPPALAAAIELALTDRPQAERRARQGRAVVRDRFRADRTARHLQELYDLWLGSASGPPGEGTGR